MKHVRRKFGFHEIVGLALLSGVAYYGYNYFKAQQQPKPQAAQGFFDTIQPYGPYLVGGLAILGTILFLTLRKRGGEAPSTSTKDVRILA